MLGSVIYEKTFPRETFEETQVLPVEILPEQLREPSGMEYLKKLLEKSTYVLLPEKMEARNLFIREAKKAADYYELDIVIKEYRNKVSAMLCVDCFAEVPELKKVIALSDGICFSAKGEQIVVLLDYYTHATFCAGRRMPPYDI